MTSLYPSLIRLVERAIQSHVEGYSSAIFPGHDEEWPRLGRHFSLQKDGSPIIIYPWFGVYDTAFGPIIYIGFNGQQGWCQPVYETAIANGLSEGRSYKMPYKDILRNELCFPLKDESLEWLKTAESEEKHEEIVLIFFAEVVNCIGQYLI